MLQNNPELKSKIDQLWNKFWSGGISNPLTAIEQITYLLFLRQLEHLDKRRTEAGKPSIYGYNEAAKRDYGQCRWSFLRRSVLVQPELGASPIRLRY